MDPQLLELYKFIDRDSSSIILKYLTFPCYSCKKIFDEPTQNYNFKPNQIYLACYTCNIYLCFSCYCYKKSRRWRLRHYDKKHIIKEFQICKIRIARGHGTRLGYTNSV